MIPFISASEWQPSENFILATRCVTVVQLRLEHNNNCNDNSNNVARMLVMTGEWGDTGEAKSREVNGSVTECNVG